MSGNFENEVIHVLVFKSFESLFNRLLSEEADHTRMRCSIPDVQRSGAPGPCQAALPSLLSWARISDLEQIRQVSPRSQIRQISPL